jgi:TonB family protein
VNPSVPLDVKPLITGETQIDVTVRIDSAGKVTRAQVTSSRGAAARLVQAEAVRAALLFRFQPARENDRAVQSRMVLTFRFKRIGE